MSNAVKVGFVMCAASMLFFACDKDKSFPDTPSLEFKELQKLSQDSILIKCYFQDGDGDIGSRIENPAEGENACPSNDILYKYYELVEGDWTHVPSFDGGWCFTSLTPIGQDKTLEGDLLVRFELPFDLPPDISPSSDSTRIGILLQDRAGHLSNEVYSPLLLRD